MRVFPENEARGSLIVVATFIIVDIVFASLAGPSGAETPGWIWIVAGIIPVYGLILGSKAILHRNYWGLVGLLLNILVVFFLIFAVAWDSGGF